MDPDNPGGVAPGVIRHKRQRACAPRSGYSGCKDEDPGRARIEGIVRIINYYGDWRSLPPRAGLV